jgi:hypothetical protein
MFEHEKRIRELIQKFGLTRKEAEGLFEESKEWTGIKNLFNKRNLSLTLILFAILACTSFVIWLFNELMKKENS